jgi:hypothetical protein
MEMPRKKATKKAPKKRTTKKAPRKKTTRKTPARKTARKILRKKTARKTPIRKTTKKRPTGRTTKKASSAKGSIDKERRGYKAVVKGLTFEKAIGAFLSKRGYEISYERKIGSARFDVFGKAEDDFGNVEYCIAECKHTRVTAGHVLRFMSKLRAFYRRLPTDLAGEKAEVEGLIAYTGELPRDARDAARGFEVPISFRRF